MFTSTIPPSTLRLLQVVLACQHGVKNAKARTVFAVYGKPNAQLHLDLFWRNAQSLHESTSSIENDILACLLHGETSSSPDAWSPRDFYDNVHVPGKNDTEAAKLVVADLESTLFPYQKRTVRWMLAREGVDINGRNLGHVHQDSEGLHGFVRTVDHYRNPIWANSWLGLVTTNDSIWKDPSMEISGVRNKLSARKRCLADHT